MRRAKPLRTPDPAVSRTVHRRAEAALVEHVHAEVFDGVAHVSRQAYDELRRQSVVPPPGLEPCSPYPPIGGLLVKVVPWLPRAVHRTRRERRRLKWAAICRRRAEARKLAEMRESVDLVRDILRRPYPDPVTFRAGDWLTRPAMPISLSNLT